MRRSDRFNGGVWSGNLEYGEGGDTRDRCYTSQLSLECMEVTRVVRERDEEVSVESVERNISDRVNREVLKWF